MGGRNDLLLKSTNGGTAFTQQNSVGRDLLYAASNGSAVYFSGADFSIANENGSLHTTPAAPDDLRGIAFKAGSTIGLAVGEKGKIARSTNSGSSWSDVTKIEPQILYATQQLNSRTGYGVGKGGAIVKTSNGGAGWEAIPTANVQDLHGLYFSSESTGVVAGKAGTLLRTTNGTSFSPVSVPTTANLADVHAADGLWLAVSSSRSLVMLRPGPEPPYCRTIALSAWVNLSKMWSTLSGAMPMAVSWTAKSSHSLSSFCRFNFTEMLTCPCLGSLTALLTMLCKTCESLS